MMKTLTQAQKEAGNYKKRTVRWAGFEVAIETPKGAVRSGADKGGNKWRVRMPVDYGYLKKTLGVDGDHVDLFLGPVRDVERAGTVWVLEQRDKATGKFDEHKLLGGFATKAGALRAYLQSFSDDARGRVGKVTAVGVKELKPWLRKEGLARRSLGEVKSGGGGMKMTPKTLDLKTKEGAGERVRGALVGATAGTVLGGVLGGSKMGVKVPNGLLKKLGLKAGRLKGGKRRIELNPARIAGAAGAVAGAVRPPKGKAQEVADAAGGYGYMHNNFAAVSEERRELWMGRRAAAEWNAVQKKLEDLERAAGHQVKDGSFQNNYAEPLRRKMKDLDKKMLRGIRVDRMKVGAGVAAAGLAGAVALRRKRQKKAKELASVVAGMRELGMLQNLKRSVQVLRGDKKLLEAAGKRKAVAAGKQKAAQAALQDRRYFKSEFSRKGQRMPRGANEEVWKKIDPVIGKHRIQKEQAGKTMARTKARANRATAKLGGFLDKMALGLGEVVAGLRELEGASLSVGRGEKLPVSRGAGLTAKGRAKYNRETGSNLQAPAPNPRTKAEAGRKKSFCARSQGWNGERGKAARKRWGCGDLGAVVMGLRELAKPYRGITASWYRGKVPRPGAGRGYIWQQVEGSFGKVPARGSEEAKKGAAMLRVYKGNPVGKEIEAMRKVLAKDPASKFKSTPGLTIQDARLSTADHWKKGDRNIKVAVDDLNKLRAKGRKEIKVHRGVSGQPFVIVDDPKGFGLASVVAGLRELMTAQEEQKVRRKAGLASDAAKAVYYGTGAVGTALLARKGLKVLDGVAKRQRAVARSAMRAGAKMEPKVTKIVDDVGKAAKNAVPAAEIYGDVGRAYRGIKRKLLVVGKNFKRGVKQGERAAMRPEAVAARKKAAAMKAREQRAVRAMPRFFGAVVAGLRELGKGDQLRYDAAVKDWKGEVVGHRKRHGRFADPEEVFLRGYRTTSGGRDAELTHRQVLNRVINKAGRERVKVQRGAYLARDAMDSLRGIERRDSSGRLKKKEWDKQWVKNAAWQAGTALAGGSILMGRRYARKHPNSPLGQKLRKVEATVKRTGRRAVRKVDEVVADGMKRAGLAAVVAGLRELEVKHGRFADPPEARYGLRGRKGYRRPEMMQEAALPGGMAAFVTPGGVRVGGKKAGIAMPKKARKAGMVIESSQPLNEVAVKASGYDSAKTMKKALRRHELVHSIQSSKRGYKAHKRLRDLLKDEVGAYATMNRRVKGGSKVLRGVNSAGGVGISMMIGTAANPRLRKRAALRGKQAGVAAAGVAAGMAMKKRREKQLAAVVAGLRELARIPVTKMHHVVPHPSAELRGAAKKIMEKGSLQVAEKKSIQEINEQGSRIMKKAGKLAARRAGSEMNVGKGGMNIPDFMKRLDREQQRKQVAFLKGHAARNYGKKMVAPGMNAKDAGLAAVVAGLRELAHPLDVGYDPYYGAPGWDVRDARGKSARVFAPGSRKRIRREKTWTEKKENRDKLAVAGAVLAAGAGLAGGYALGKGKSKPTRKPRVTRPKGNIVRGTKFG
jgi:hypothetical protein